jgi:hypothetical protein
MKPSDLYYSDGEFYTSERSYHGYDYTTHLDIKSASFEADLMKLLRQIYEQGKKDKADEFRIAIGKY